MSLFRDNVICHAHGFFYNFVGADNGVCLTLFCFTLFTYCGEGYSQGGLTEGKCRLDNCLCREQVGTSISKGGHNYQSRAIFV